MKKLLCIVGMTASGKDTLAGYLSEKYGLRQVVSYTTRPKRTYEQDGKEHYFITPEQVEEVKRQSNIVAYTRIGPVEYFATEEELMNSDIYIIDPMGVSYLKNYIYSNDLPLELSVIGLKVPFLDMYRRAKERGDDPEVFFKRSDSEMDEFISFFNKVGTLDYLFINDKGIDALQRFGDYIYEKEVAKCSND